jgi:hypothetical protein
MDLRAVLENTVVELRGIPHVIIESADILPGRTPDTVATFTELPAWLVEMYTQVGGAHISWRLAPAGYEELNPGQKDNAYRYDVSGNLDILTPEEVVGGFTGKRVTWHDVPHLDNYLPVDFADFYTSMGFVPPDAVGPAVNFYDTLEPLEISVVEYLRQGADLLFLDGWVTIDEDSAAISKEARAHVRRLRRSPATPR